MSTHYVYLLLDPRKKGSFVYGKLKLAHEPFYVGKTKTRKREQTSIRSGRPYDHIKGEGKHVRSHKYNKICKIKAAGKEPLVFIYRKGIKEEHANIIERFLIAKIGRYDLNTGPLTNKTSGGDGVSGFKRPPEMEVMRIANMKAAINNMSIEEKTKWYNNVKEAWASKSKKELEAFAEVSSKRWSGYDEERRKNIGRKLSISRIKYLNSLTPEERSNKASKGVATLKASGRFMEVRLKGRITKLKNACKTYESFLENNFDKAITLEDDYVAVKSKFKSRRPVLRHICAYHGEFYKDTETLKRSRYGCPKCNKLAHYHKDLLVSAEGYEVIVESPEYNWC